MLFDSLQIGVAELDSAVRDYQTFLAQAGERRGALHRFQLQRGAVELTAGEPGVRSLRFRREAGDADPPRDWNGIGVLLDAGVEEAGPAPAGAVPHAIDHVVVQSPDLDRAVGLWRDRAGIRLALDRDFPQRGLRILFFRSAGVTLEFSGALGAAAAGSDRLWGVAYQVADLDACRARLLDAGVEVSAIRAGQKSGTRVATPKSHVLGAPTLLIQPAG